MSHARPRARSSAALQALGYSLGEAREASRLALNDATVGAGLEERVKAALRTPAPRLSRGPAMRIAFACNPALGHVLPLLPLASAARDAGHEVAILAGASSADRSSARGSATSTPGRPTSRPRSSTSPSARADRPAPAPRRRAKRAFGGVIAPGMAAGLLGLARDWRPDLLVHDDSELGTWVAAERLGIPHVSLQATAWRGTGVRLAAEPLDRLRASLGLPEDPGLARWHRHGYLTTRPPSLVNPDDPMPATTIPLRPVARDDEPGDAPPWLDRGPAGRPGSR